MPIRELPRRPNWEQLRTQAKDLLRESRAASPDLPLAYAQRELAAQYGFSSWARLKKQVAFLLLIGAIEDDDSEAFQAALDNDRSLAVWPDDGGPTALHWAAWHGRVEAIERLLKLGADLDRVETEFGARPAGWANENGQAEARDLLIERGASIDLSRAAMMGRLDIVEKILRDNPAEARRVDLEDWPPLVQAAGWGRLDVMEALLAAGTDPNAAGLEGSTPLHAAAGWNGEMDAVRILLGRGADPTIVDARGQTPAQLAEEQGFMAAAALIGSHSNSAD